MHQFTTAARCNACGNALELEPNAAIREGWRLVRFPDGDSAWFCPRDRDSSRLAEAMTVPGASVVHRVQE